MNHSLLRQIEYRIHEDSVPRGEKHFGGAGLIITDQPDHHCKDNDTKVVVSSPFAGEISWVVKRMREVFTGEIDHLNKYCFFPEMGRAALIAISSGRSRREILLAVVNAAKDFWSNRPLPADPALRWATERLRRRAYFAYGSNLSHEQMKERCPEASFVDAGVVAGYRFLINERGVATIVQDPVSEVHGGIYLITDSEAATLDRCEGVGSGCYEKKTLEVTTAGNKTRECLVYIDSRATPGPPRDGYLDTILRGACDCGLPPEYIEFLKTFVDPLI